jgi:hypothetical protein
LSGAEPWFYQMNGYSGMVLGSLQKFRDGAACLGCGKITSSLASCLPGLEVNIDHASLLLVHVEAVVSLVECAA